ncbi:F-box protein FBW2 [Hibiscus syriacus]|uniref:F-box protein FBW2 n=1 Tax=Hibiscus syriacus TaxID=106335 RepID=A0A6A3CS44_HIBSY|nr:F-box protein FBW2-like [Hibiscus syriacus]XP_039023351.1 F-box protein FBW2-like [Hibiscus syriacus]KAE8731274.1 F-box protein FBW2 [Hibiscus syriacus]
MDEQCDFRGWDELIPDALGQIFSNLSLQEILTVIPCVCKSWRAVVMGPYCWQEIDIEEWSNGCQPDHPGRMLQMLITRSSGSLRKLCVSGLQNDTIFSFVTENAGSLRSLRLPRSEMSDLVVEQTAGRLSSITCLDLSYCGKIGARALEAIGKHCKLLVSLCRNMHPLDAAGKLSQDDEANAIAATMPRLKRLEMAYHLISTASVLKILSGCLQLEFFDLRGCWDVKLDDQFVKEKFPKLKVLGPLVMDCYEMGEWDDCSDFSDSFEYLAWEFEMGNYDEDDDDDDDDDIFDEMWHGEGILNDFELRFYDGIGGDAGMLGWPPSP